MGHSALAAVLIFALGACIGSFANLVAHRLPRELSIIMPRSFCPACHLPIRAWENIPVISWLLLRGRCARCGAAIGFRAILIEAVLGAAALWLYLNFQPADALARFALCTALLIVAIIDFDHSVIFSIIPVVGVVAGFLAATLVMPEIGWFSSAIGIVAGSGFLFLTGIVYRAIRHVEGIGLGDIYLMAMVGAFLGWPGALFTLFAGSLLGSVGGLAMVLAERPVADEPVPEAIAMVVGAPPPADTPLLRRPIPFGPFLALAAASFALFQPQLLDWYLGR
jgi:leader peptidase (prepilin peptidase) / N-methyltransferase